MKTNGIKSIINKCRKEFRIPENVNHYSEKDFKHAEKKYLKLCLRTGSGISPSAKNPEYIYR